MFGLVWLGFLHSSLTLFLTLQLSRGFFWLGMVSRRSSQISQLFGLVWLGFLHSSLSLFLALQLSRGFFWLGMGSRRSSQISQMFGLVWLRGPADFFWLVFKLK